MLTKTIYHWLSKEHVATEGLECFFRLFFLVEHHEGLAPHSHVLLRMHLHHFSVVREQLVELVLDLGDLDSFVQVLEVKRGVGLQHWLVSDSLSNDLGRRRQARLGREGHEGAGGRRTWREERLFLLLGGGGGRLGESFRRHFLLRLHIHRPRSLQ